MTHNPSLTNLIQRVTSAIRVVDDHVLRSEHIMNDVLQLEPGVQPVGFNHLNPEARIENLEDTEFWEEYFEFLLKEWDDDDDGDRLSEAAFNFNIDRLSAAARRRNIPGLVKDERTEDSASNELLVTPTVSRKLRGILPIVAQVLAPQNRTWKSPEYLSTIQDSVMQLLGLYITLLPALRHQIVRKSYEWWSFAIAALSGTLAVLLMGCYFYSPAVSQLALFLSSAMQAAIVMQMEFAVERVVGSEGKEK
ncbi:hypothetical protein QBC38DRAFT_371830 [Podospora fimiseda]|uniref:Uncharacterized protein n=1 Tax=Podospora fimiseda TaxID=252190 RepID=A0AAN7GPP3_9PEZI|nr:hypothetical protein QBC38DRAFT_371830 [Podospora fimiseda]